MDYTQVFFLSAAAVLLFAAGFLACRLWLSKAKAATTHESHLIVDKVPQDNTEEKDLELMKKDLRHRQNLQSSTPDWGDN